jgi:large subunit ribosomal protein L15
MSGELSRLSHPAGARHSEKRVGRGTGSKLGKTCGRGTKGQKKRSGGNINKLHFQGGQTPLQRRLPKRGFRVPFPAVTVEVNWSDLERFENGSVVNEQALRDARLLQVRDARVKVIGSEPLTKKLTVEAYKFSKGAALAIEKAGGKAVVLADNQDAPKA